MVVTEIPPVEKMQEKIRLAAYCRVSSDSTDQLNSFAAQIRHYTDYAKTRPDCELVDIYADEGITGTSMKKRGEFNRLIDDCRNHKIDCVITKSVSRFARNTSDLLTVLRMLKALNVRVYFEEQGLDSDIMNAELFVALPGLAAQQESVNISDNLRWSYKKRMENGEFLGYSSPYGYDFKDEKLVVNIKEAKIVKRIFEMFLSGIGKQTIANILNEENHPPSKFGEKWHMSAVSYILSNERYIGNALLQKKYTTTTLPFMRKRNKGEQPQYYVEGSNEAIISKETFNAAQELLKRRNISFSRTSYPLGGIIKCRECGHNYRRMLIRGKTYWDCSYKTSLKTDCQTKMLREDDIYSAFVNLMFKLKMYKSEILDQVIDRLEYIENAANPNQSLISEIDSLLANLSAQNHMVARLHTKAILSESEYSKQTSAINAEISKLRSKRKALLTDDSDAETIADLKLLQNCVENFDYQKGFDEEMFSQCVTQILADCGDKLVFTLVGGLKLTETIEGSGNCGKTKG